MNRHEAFISQLDGLVVVLAAAHEEVFATIRGNSGTWFPESQDPKLPDTFDSYRVTVSNAAFVLGYAYFESFLSDLARETYRRRPTMLPREKQVSFGEVLGATSPDAMLQLLIEKEIRSVFYGPIEDVKNHFRQKLQVPWPDHPSLEIASRLRNCLMHNGGLVDQRAAELSGRPIGSQIRFNPGEVHAFGLEARTLSGSLWNEARSRHLEGAG